MTDRALTAEWLAALFLTLLLNPLLAQDDDSEPAPHENPIQFVEPADGFRLKLNQEHRVTVQIADSVDISIPASDDLELSIRRRVRFETTFGELTDAEVFPTDSGFARTHLRSPTPGEARITATVQGIGSATRTVEFWPPEEPDGKYYSGGFFVPLAIADDRIAIQTVPGTSWDDVIHVVEEADLVIKRYFYRGIFELEAADSMDPEDLMRRALAIVDAEGEEDRRVQHAGFLVHAHQRKVPWLMLPTILAGYADPLTQAQRTHLFENYAISEIEEIGENSQTYKMSISDAAAHEVLEIAAELLSDPELQAEFAHPDFVVPINGRSIAPYHDKDGNELDPRLAEQWHHHNPGNGDAIADADIDSLEAWKISTGATTHPLIAIIDSSFSVTHPDLVENLWVDDKGVIGKNFDGGRPDWLLDDPYDLRTHGTAVAGIVGAVANNLHIGRGVCPHCRLLLLKHGGRVGAEPKAINFAIEQNADVISNSWSSVESFDAVRVAVDKAIDARIPVIFATSSGINVNHCDDERQTDLSSLENVIAVSSVTNEDRRTHSGYGNCVDLLAPTARGKSRGITTTGVFYDAANDEIYNGVLRDFSGTSAAVPMVSGIIGLILDVNPGLSPKTIQRVLQDTADKVEPCEGMYGEETGYSFSGADDATHAYGRVNAFEAVSLVAPLSATPTDRLNRGHGGQDLFIRDHYLDWGNTINPSNELFTPTEPRETIAVNKSVDIRLSEDENRVLVKVRNRGHEPVRQARLFLYWTINRQLPQLPTGFWNTLGVEHPSVDPQTWNPLPMQLLPEVVYSGASAPEAAIQVPVDLPTNSSISSNIDRLAILAVVHSDDDPVLVHAVTTAPINIENVETAVASDNNVALWVYREKKPTIDCGGGPASPELVLALLIVAIYYRRNSRFRP